MGIALGTACVVQGMYLGVKFISKQYFIIK